MALRPPRLILAGATPSCGAEKILEGLQPWSGLAGTKNCVNEEASPDSEVCRLLQRGNRARAFEMLLSRYQRKVFRLALSYVRSSADAEDLAQEAFVRVWRALPGYDGRASFSTWIYVIARNACLSELRRRRRRPTSPLDEGAETRGGDGPFPAAASDLRLDCAALGTRCA